VSTHATDPVIEALSREHAPALLAWARSRFADPRDAEEVVADTLVRAWRAIDQFDPERGSERAWLFGIARNTAVDHHRRSRRHLRSVPVGEVVDPEPHDDPGIARVADASLVLDALGALSEAHRQTVLAAYYGGRTTAEIAAEHDVPPGTVKSRLYYALRSLRGHLEERGVLR
jgi:RNA polymerase sigma-70 factor (ECF subfamily)